MGTTEALLIPLILLAVAVLVGEFLMSMARATRGERAALMSRPRALTSASRSRRPAAARDTADTSGSAAAGMMPKCGRTTARSPGPALSRELSQHTALEQTLRQPPTGHGLEGQHRPGRGR
jgi:hypothetical protein